MRRVCYSCGKEIKGEMVLISPSILQIKLWDSDKPYHPKCYEKEEIKARRELIRNDGFRAP